MWIIDFHDNLQIETKTTIHAGEVEVSMQYFLDLPSLTLEYTEFVKFQTVPHCIIMEWNTYDWFVSFYQTNA